MPATLLSLMVLSAIMVSFGLVTFLLSRGPRKPQRADAGDGDYTRISLPGLLSAADADFVARTGGPALVARFRAHRRAVASAHLDGLSAEFELASAELKRHLASSAGDRPDLVAWLARESLRFQLGARYQRLCLALHWAGLQPDLRWLETSLARVRRQGSRLPESVHDPIQLLQ